MKGSKSKSSAKQSDSKSSMRTAIRIRSPNKRKSKSGAKQSDSKLPMRTAIGIRSPNKRKSKSGAKIFDSNLLVRMSSRKPNKPKLPKLPVEPAPDFVIYADESGFHERFRQEHPDIKSFAVITRAGLAEWNSLSDAEKAPYVAEYEKRMKVHNVLMEEHEKRFAEYVRLNRAYLDKKLADGEASTDMEDDSDSELEDLLFDDDFVCVQLLPKTF